MYCYQEFVLKEVGIVFDSIFGGLEEGNYSCPRKMKNNILAVDMCNHTTRKLVIAMAIFNSK